MFLDNDFYLLIIFSRLNNYAYSIKIKSYKIIIKLKYILNKLI